MTKVATLTVKDSVTCTQPLACDRCKKSKTKCNRQMPSCSTCIDKKFECTYTTQKLKRGPKPGTPPKHNMRRINDNILSSLNMCKEISPNLKFTHSLELWDISRSSIDANAVAYFKKQQRLMMTDEEGNAIIPKCLLNVINVLPQNSFMSSSINFRSAQILQAVLNNSLIDNSSKSSFIKSSSGDIEYLGNSPIIFLVCNYIGTFYTKTQQGPKPPSERRVNKLMAISASEVNIPAWELLLNEQLMFDLSQAFFKHYNPTFPLLDQDIFYKDYFYQCNLLTYYVCAAGARYFYGPQDPSIIDFYDNLAFNTFLTVKFKPSISVCIVYLMMAQYLVKYSEFNKSVIFLGKGILMAQRLGCHIATQPRRLSSSVIQMKKRIWWACCILDKLYAFGMNRHLLLHKENSDIPPPKLPVANYFSPLGEQDIVRIGSELCFRHMYTLSFLMGEAVFLLKANQGDPKKVDIDKKRRKTEKLITKLEEWLQNQSNELHPYINGQSSEVYHGFKSFIYVPKLIYHSIVIQLCLPYHDYEDPEVRKKFQLTYTKSSTEIILAAKNMESQFISCGVTYRFYSLTSAILVQVFNYKNGNGDKENSMEFINVGLEVLMNCTSIFPLAQECHNLVNDVLGSEEVNPDPLNFFQKS